MPGIIDLKLLLLNMNPVLDEQEFAFCFVGEGISPGLELDSVFASIRENEGWTLVLERGEARRMGMSMEGSYRRIVLGVHSALEAVGLTAAVSTVLAEHGIAANIIAAFHHDHVFVPAERADEAIRLLHSLARN